MQFSALSVAPRALLPGEDPRAAEVASTISQELDELVGVIRFDLSGLAAAADVTPAAAAVGAELLEALRRAQELGRLLKLTA